MPDVCLWLVSPGLTGDPLALTICELKAPLFVSSQYLFTLGDTFAK